ncbi:MAG: glycosyltransferase [Dehalococcoidia bacterium]|nr:glycosyltransferase [Dehalococcoidia bacterium]
MESKVVDDTLISFVMPCLNEEASVGDCVRQARAWLDERDLLGEVIIVDNGSVDRSPVLAAEAGALVVVEPVVGYGRAIRTGLSHAGGRFIVVGDSDGTYDFSRIDPLIDGLRAGSDLVIGNRLAGNIEPGAMPWLHQHIGTPLISMLLRTTSGTTVGDSQSGLRALTRDARDSLDLSSNGMEFASEMILKARKKDLRVSEAPVPYYVRRGESKLRPFRDGWRHLRLLLLLTPETTFLAIALAFLIAGAAVQITSAVATSQLHWQPVYLGTILMVVGLNAFVVGGIARLHAVKRGLLKPDWLVSLFARRAGLELMGSVAIALFVGGIALDVAIFISWLSGSEGSYIWQGSLAQAMILLGVNLGLVALVVGLYQSEP